MKQTKRNPNQANLAKTSQSLKQKAPLREHLQELKRRLLYVAVSVGILSGVAYSVENHLISILLRPSHGQHFVYTSPLGGVNFLFSICLFVGIALSIPVIVFNLLHFLLPLMRSTTTKFIYGCSVASGVVAVGGILFGYYAGLPAALHFLLHQFHNSQVSALISIQSYFSFVTAYMVGAAIMFQLPLLLIIINRIKPLKPSQMFKAERAVIAFAFIAGFIMNPTPNVIDQMFVVVPIIIMYQLGIGLVWVLNRRDGRLKYHSLFQQDAIAQAERLRQASSAQRLLGVANSIASEPILTALAQQATPTQQPTQTVAAPVLTPLESSQLSVTRTAYANQYVSRPARTSYSSFSPRLIQ